MGNKRVLLLGVVFALFCVAAVGFTMPGAAAETPEKTATAQSGHEFNITAVNAPPTVEGQELVVTTSIENTGTASGSQSVNLNVPGVGTNSTDVTIGAGAQTDVELSVETGIRSTLGSPYVAVVTTGQQGVSTEAVVRLPAIIGDSPPRDLVGDGQYEDIRGDGEFDIFDVQALFANLDRPVIQNHVWAYSFQGENPNEVTIFDVQSHFFRLNEDISAPASFDVELTSAPTEVSEGETIPVEFTVENTGELAGTQTLTLDGGALGTNSTNVSLAGGASTTETLTLDTGDGDAGIHTLLVSSANDTAVSFATVQASANFTVNNISPADATVINGTEIDVSADIQNVGGAQGTQTVTLSIDGVTESQSVTLNASETKTVTFRTIDTGVLGIGSYTHEIASANDSASGSLTVEAAPAAPTFLVSNIDPLGTVVSNGTVIDVSADVENVGDRQGTQTLTLTIGGFSDTKSLTLNSSETQTVTFQNVDTGVVGPGSYSHEIASANDSASGSLTVEAPANFTVTNLTPADTTVTNGTLIDVSADIQNVGDVQGSQTITLTIDGYSDTQSVILAAGATQTVTFQNVDTGALGLGNYTHEIASVNDTASGNLTVVGVANFTVSNLSPADATVPKGDVIEEVSADIENVGSIQGTQTITLTIGDFSATKSLTLNTGEAQTVTFRDIDTGELDPGSYSHEIASANDSASGSLTVEAPANFTVTNLTPADTAVVNGTEIDVSADIENVGTLQGTQTLTLTIGGFSTTKLLTLNGSETQTVTFQNVDTGAVGVGSYTHEIASANDSASGNLTVQAPANFAVTIESTNAPVVEGETLSVNATIENTGDASGTQTITLDVENFGSTSTTLPLAGGASTTETLTLATSKDDASNNVTVTVASEDDEASTTVDILVGESFDAEITDAPNGVRETEEIVVEFTVENTGNATGTQDIQFLVDGQQNDSISDQTLNPGENVTGTFTYPTSESEAGETLSVEVRTEDDSAQEEVLINQTELIASLSDETASVGDTVQVAYDVTSGLETEQDVDAYELEISFDTDVLEYEAVTGGEFNGAFNDDVQNGVVQAVQVGEDSPTPLEPMVFIEFTVVGQGTSEVGFVPGGGNILNAADGSTYETAFLNGSVDAS